MHRQFNKDGQDGQDNKVFWFYTRKDSSVLSLEFLYILVKCESGEINKDG
jgi:hypothetical protein